MRIRLGLTPSAIGLILGVIHLVVAAWLFRQPFEGSWGYLPLVVPDFPVTLILVLLADILESNWTWGGFIVFGSVWWYFVGFLLGKRLMK